MRSFIDFDGKPMASILILGGDSVIGKALRDYLGMSHDVTVTTRRERSLFGEHILFMDALNPVAANVDFGQFDIIINVIAYSKFDYCRENSHHARKINIDFPLYIARNIPDSTRFIQFSTSAVFSCETPLQRADDCSFARSEYGRQKREADDGVLAVGGEIFRISKVLLSTDILGEMLNKLKQGLPVEVFYDLYLCPLSIESVMQAIQLVIEEGQSSIYQLSGDLDLSYAEALCLIATNHNCDQSLITRSSCKGIVYSDHVLRYTSLCISKMFKHNSFLDLKHQNLIRRIYG